MEQITVDINELNELKEVVDNAKKPIELQHPLSKYANHIAALRMLDVKYRYIAIWLSNKTGIKTTNNQLSTLFCRLRARGLVNVEIAKQIAKQIVEDEEETQPNSSLSDKARSEDVGYTVMQFMNKLSAAGCFVQDEGLAMKQFYNEFASKYSLDDLVQEYLLQKSSERV